MNSTCESLVRNTGADEDEALRTVPGTVTTNEPSVLKMAVLSILTHLAMRFTSTVLHEILFAGKIKLWTLHTPGKDPKVLSSTSLF